MECGRKHSRRRQRPLAVSAVDAAIQYPVPALTDPVAIGIIVALVLCNPAGITGTTWLPTNAAKASLGRSLKWIDVFGMSLLAGIGFTVSLLVAELSFGQGRPRRSRQGGHRRRVAAGRPPGGRSARHLEPSIPYRGRGISHAVDRFQQEPPALGRTPTAGPGNLRPATVPSRSTISASRQSSRGSSGWLMRPTSKLRWPAAVSHAETLTR